MPIIEYKSVIKEANTIHNLEMNFSSGPELYKFVNVILTNLKS